MRERQAERLAEGRDDEGGGDRVQLAVGDDGRRGRMLQRAAKEFVPPQLLHEPVRPARPRKAPLVEAVFSTRRSRFLVQAKARTRCLAA